MAINLFSSILDKTNSGLTPSAGFVPSQTPQQPTIPNAPGYTPFITPEQKPYTPKAPERSVGGEFPIASDPTMGKNLFSSSNIGNTLYDYAHTPIAPSEDVIQKLLDDSAIDITRKQSLLQALNDGAPEDEVRQHISQNYYPETQTQFHETIPTASPWMTGYASGPMAGVQTVANILPDLWNVGAGIGNIASTAIQEGPIDTANMMAKGLIKSGGDIANNVQQTYQNKGGIQGTADLLGGLNESISTHPVQYGLAVAPTKVAGMVGDLAKPIVGKAGEVLTDINPLSRASLQTKAENISTRANRFNAGDERKFVEQIKETPGQFAVSRGLRETGDTAVTKAIENYSKSIDSADTGLSQIEGKFSTKGQPDDVIGELIMANRDKMMAQPRNPDATLAQELYSKYENRGLTMSEINEAKRIYSRNHKYSYEQLQSDQAKNSKYLQDAVREKQFQIAQENGLTNLAEINRETKGWRMYADSLSRKINGAQANNSMGITDWISLSGGNPSNIALFLGKKALSSEFAKTAIIKTLGKQTKPSIIAPSKDTILKSNLEKKYANPDNISGDLSMAGGNSMVRNAGLLPAGEKIIARQNNKELSKRLISEQKAKEDITKQAKKETQGGIINRPPSKTIKNDQQQVSKSPASTKSDSAITPVAKKPIVKEIKPISNEAMPDSILNVIKGSKSVDEMVSKLRKEINNSYQFRDLITEYQNKGGKNLTYDELFSILKTKPTGANSTPTPKPILKAKESAPVKTELSEKANSGESGKVIIGNEVKKDLITIDGKKYNGKDIEIDGKKVGGVQYRTYPTANKTIELSKIEIFPEFRGNNYAKKLIEKLFADSPESKDISLYAAKSAIPVWQKLGFKPTGHIAKEGPVYELKRTDFIPDGYHKNIFGDIVKDPSNKNGGFIRNPFAKIQPKNAIESKGGVVKNESLGNIMPKKLANKELSLLVEGSKKGHYDGSYDKLDTGKRLYRGIIDNKGEKGRFFTDNKDVADSFGDADTITRDIIFKNPIDTRSLKIQKYLKENTDINIDKAINPYRRDIGEFNKLVKWAEDNGFDGVIGKTSDNGMQYLGNEYVPTRLNKKFYEQAPTTRLKNESLIEEAKKYKSVDDFIKAHMAKDLMDLSNPSKHRIGRLIEDGIDEDTGRYMDAKYTADRYGIRGNNEYKYQKSANVPDVKSKEDIVTIYRSTSKKQKEMLPGDFVSFSKDYAEMHNQDGHTLIMKVPAKDVVFQGNDLHEWIYSPESLRGESYNGGLRKIYEQAHRKNSTK